MTRLNMKKKLTEANDRIARGLRERLQARDVLALNIISSPGSGKTSLLEKTLAVLPEEWRASVVTGDIATDNDARRLIGFGYPVAQITTGGACHLDARMVARHVCPGGFDESGEWKARGVWKPDFDILFIENVGNLVCPAGFDLGETAKVVVISTAEGDDKPLKYPTAFIKSELVVLNKIDLLPHVNFDVRRFRRYAEQVHPGIGIVELSCKTGEGVDEWMAWLRDRKESLRRSVARVAPSRAARV
jgi:hydrogenase nickel incorporation protein HypB